MLDSRGILHAGRPGSGHHHLQRAHVPAQQLAGPHQGGQHDDQHGTAIVVLAALMGAGKLLGRDMSSLKVVMSETPIAIRRLVHATPAATT
ncbi:hypothetical protein MAHJHV47_45280 [Mycobacterium avium subsp. hominissuis]